MKASSLRGLLMTIISVVAFLPQGTFAKDDDDTPAPTPQPVPPDGAKHSCSENKNCQEDMHGFFSEEDKCFQDDQFHMLNREEGYCWIDNIIYGRCMNKRSLGEPCTNEDGHKDNNLCVTAYCNEDAFCERREGAEKDCKDKDTGKTNMVYKGWTMLDQKYKECEGNCDADYQCAGDLKCWHRSADHPAIPPGCSGYPEVYPILFATPPDPTLAASYCYDPWKMPGLQYHGEPSWECKCLAECWGDCDSDRDCYGGLKCYQRNHGDPIPPGCRYGNVDPGEGDFCYDPNNSPDNREDILFSDIEPSPFEIALEFSSWRAVQVVCGLMVILLAACCVCIVFTGFGRRGVYGENKKYVTVKTEDSDVELSEVEAMNK